MNAYTRAPRVRTPRARGRTRAPALAREAPLQAYSCKAGGMFEIGLSNISKIYLKGKVMIKFMQHAIHTMHLILALQEQ